MFGSAQTVALRRFPAPFRAALAIHSDADDAAPRALADILAFFRETLGLPATGSLFFWAPPPQASWFDDAEGRRPRDRDLLADLCRRGWIDAIHGLGDYNDAPPPGRELARRALDDLAQAGARLPLWTNHGNPRNAQNVLRWSGRGDLPGPQYIADLLREHGVRFVWPQRITHVPGQDRPCAPGEYYASYPNGSPLRRALARSHAWVARRLDIEPFDGNDLARIEPLRDGTPMYTFRRYGIWKRDGAPNLAEILAPARLDRLVETGGAAIVYVHLARGWPADLSVLEHVAERSRAGDLWVVPASRLLRHSVVRDALRWRVEPERILIDAVEDPVLGRVPTADDLATLAFNDPAGRKVVLA